MKILPEIFTYEDVEDLYPNPKNFYAYVNRACKRGELKQIKKGLYALIDRSTGGQCRNSAGSIHGGSER